MCPIQSFLTEINQPKFAEINRDVFSVLVLADVKFTELCHQFLRAGKARALSGPPHADSSFLQCAKIIHGGAPLTGDIP